MPADTIPDTAAYLALGLTTIALVMGLFVASLVLRFRSLRAALRALEADQNTP